MRRLHYFPGNASLTPHILLHEIGVPFELALVDRSRAAHKSPAYLRLNPNGLIPVLEDDGLVLYETAAIVLHLVERHPQSPLAPPPGTDERSTFYKWLLWLSSTVQAMMPHYFYSDRMVDAGNEAGARQVKAHAEARLAELMDQLDGHLAGRTWMMGERFSALDPYAFMLGRWTRGMTRPARERTHLGPFLQRVLARPATQAALSAEGLTPPWV